MSNLSGMRSLALLRAMFGGWLVWKALPNLDPEFVKTLPSYLEWFGHNNPFSWYRMGLFQLAIPNVHHVAEVLVIGQLMIGAALIIGFLTRFFSAMGLVYTGLFLLATYHLGWHFQGMGIMQAMILLTLYVADAGHFYGLDGFLFKDADDVKPAKGRSARNKNIKNKKQKKVIDTLANEMKNRKKKKPKAKVVNYDDDDDDDDD